MKSLIDLTVPFVGTILLMRMPPCPWLRPLVERSGATEIVINCGRVELYLTGHWGRWPRHRY